LPAIVAGKAGPAVDDRERMLRAYLCLVKGFPAAAARLYVEGFGARPEFVRDGSLEPRWHAIWAAALAGCGRGSDGVTLAEAERRHWRRQALAWLQAERDGWRPNLEGDNLSRRATARSTLGGWRSFRDLAPLREPAELQKLPEDERRDWQSFWTALDDLIRPRHP
jgi:hypothetical protein